MGGLVGPRQASERVRDMTGWQGLARCPGQTEAWTCRLQARPGVFGCQREDGWEKAGRAAADFGLYYFPTPEDPLFDRFSLAAEWSVLKDDFQAHVRDFAATPEMSRLFRLGKATLVVSREPQRFCFRLDALERDILILTEGLRTEEGWVVAPGEAEQDLPSWMLARELFHARPLSVIVYCRRAGPLLWRSQLHVTSPSCSIVLRMRYTPAASGGCSRNMARTTKKTTSPTTIDCFARTGKNLICSDAENAADAFGDNGHQGGEHLGFIDFRTETAAQDSPVPPHVREAIRP